MKHVLPGSYVSFRNGLIAWSVGPVKDGYTRHTVFGDIMQIVSSDDNSTRHFCRHDLASQDTAADRNISSERAFLIYGQ